MPIANTRLEILQICKLLQCVRDGDKDQIEKMTISGIPHLINYNEPNEGDTALTIAASANNDEMIRFLLELGAHPDVVDFKGRSAVMRAAEFGHVQCMEALANAKCDMKLRDLEGKGILFYLICPTQRHTRCLEIALEHGADVNNVGKDGKSVFLVACQTAADNEDMCVQMLLKGADPNSTQEKEGRTALMAASASNSVKVARAILQRGGEVNAADRHKITATHEAARSGAFEVLVCLASYGADFDVVDDKGNTPIHFAANGQALCCKFLGQRGCNPKTKNNEGNLPKNIAKDNGHKDCGKELRKVEKSFGKVGKNNEPWAIELYDWANERNKEIVDTFQKFDPDLSGFVPKEDFVECLQNMGAPLPPEESDMKTFLVAHDKNRDGNIEYNDFLTGKKYVNKLWLMSAYEGKKKKKKGGKGKKKKGKTKIPMPICTQPDGPRTPGGGPPEQWISKHMHFTDTTRFDRDRPPEHPLQDDSAWYVHHPEKAFININDAAKYGDLDTLKNAFLKGTHVDTRDKYFKTPLMTACAHGNLNVARFLLEQGADIHARDNFKWTPLHHAAHAGQLDLVECLIDSGADMDAVAMNGGTPLMRAIESSRIDVVQYLINKGAKVQIENVKGQNPVDVAISWADMRVLAAIQTKWDSLPQPKDKDKKGKGKGKGGKTSPVKRSESAPPGKETEVKFPPVLGRASSPSDEPLRQRKGSILRAASALAKKTDKEDINYVPLKSWTKQPTTHELITEKVVRRNRYGFEVDFPDFQMPFNKNVAIRCDALGGFDDDD